MIENFASRSAVTAQTVSIAIGFVRRTYAGSNAGLIEVCWNKEETTFVVLDHVDSVANESLQCLG